MSDSVGTLKTNIIANAAGFVAGMKQAAAAAGSGVSSIRRSFDTLGMVAGKAGISVGGGLGGLAGGLMSPGMMGVGALGGMFAWVQETASKVKEMHHGAEKLGVGVEAYQEIQRAAFKSGTTMDAAAAGMNHMRRSVYEANTGNKQLAQTLSRIGVDARQIAGMDTAGQFEAIAAGLAKIGNQTERTGLEMEIFGRGGAELDPMIRKTGQGGLKQFHKAFDLDDTDVRIWEEQKNTLTKDVPGMAQKAYATMGKMYNQVGAEIGGWLQGHMGGGEEYLHDQDIINSIEKQKAQAAAADLGPIAAPATNAEYGSQGGASAMFNWQLLAENQKQTELMRHLVGQGAGQGLNNGPPGS